MLDMNRNWLQLFANQQGLLTAVGAPELLCGPSSLVEEWAFHAQS